MEIGRLLIIVGITLLLAGVIFTFLPRLPGDILIKRGNFTFFIPIVTSIIISIILTILLNLFLRK